MNFSIVLLSLYSCKYNESNSNNAEHQPLNKDSIFENKMLEQLNIYTEGFIFGNNFEEGYKLLFPEVRTHFLQKHPQATASDFKLTFKKMSDFFIEAKEKGVELNIEKPKIIKKHTFKNVIIYKLSVASSITFQGKTQHNEEKNLALSFDNGISWSFIQVSEDTKEILEFDSRITKKMIKEVLEN